MAVWHWFMLAWLTELTLTALALHHVVGLEECDEDERDEPQMALWLDFFFSVAAFVSAFVVFAEKRDGGDAKRGVPMFVFVFSAAAATVASATAMGTLLVTCLPDDDDDMEYSNAFHLVQAALFFDVVATGLAHAVKRRQPPYQQVTQPQQTQQPHMVILCRENKA